MAVARDAELLRDHRCSLRVVAGDHHRPDAGPLRPRDCLTRLVAGRIDHPDEAREHQIALDRFADPVGRDLRIDRGTERDTQGAEAAPRERVIRVENLA